MPDSEKSVSDTLLVQSVFAALHEEKQKLLSEIRSKILIAPPPDLDDIQ